MLVKSQYFLVGIEHKEILNNSIIKIEQKKKKFIRFIFNKNQYIEIDMSDNGYEGPEALQVGNSIKKYWDIVRGEENWKD